MEFLLTDFTHKKRVLRNALMNPVTDVDGKHYAVTSVIRFGTEHIDDIIADLERGFAAVK